MDLNSIDNPDNKINKYILEMIKTSFNYFVSKHFMVNMFSFILNNFKYLIFKKNSLKYRS
jgi:hypothetical protein